MSHLLYNELLLSFAAMGAGFVSAITGGSGLIMLPLLLLSGISPHFALGTSKLYTTSSLFTSAMTFFKNGFFDPRLWKLMIIATLMGSIFGVILVQLMNSVVLSKVLPFFIIAVALYFLLKKPGKNALAEDMTSGEEKHKKSILVGGLLGIYSGFFGAATGTLYTALGMSVFKMPLLEASAMSRFLAFIANGTALLIFVFSRQVNYSLGLCLVITGVLGAYFGTKLTMKLSSQTIRVLIVLTSTLMGVVLLYKAWF